LPVFTDQVAGEPPDPEKPVEPNELPACPDCGAPTELTPDDPNVAQCPECKRYVELT
jgi:uncharacterized paraquat-inducible protein A